MKTWLIYKHTNTVTGKSYIGQTCYSLQTRWVKHCSDAKLRPVSYFHRAINKYGTDVWKSEVLVDGIPTLDEANQLEVHYINEYSTYTNGYNNTLGGDSNITNSKTLKVLIEGIRKYHKTRLVLLYNVETGQVLDGYPGDIEKQLQFPQGSLGDVVYENRKSYKNWVLFKNKDYCPVKRYWFVHDVYGEAYGSIDEMCRNYKNITSRGNFSGVVYGTRKSHQGWKLMDKDR